MATDRDDGAFHELLHGLRANAESCEAVTREVRTVAAALTLMLGRRLDEAGRARLEALRVSSAPKRALAEVPDKYVVENAEVDCAARMHLCHGRCCSLKVTLSRQDLEEGQLKFQLESPYHLAQNDEGHCVYQDRETGFCGTYPNRPGQCRSWSCRDDIRVWLDFDKRIPAPMPIGLIQIRRRKATP